MSASNSSIRQETIKNGGEKPDDPPVSQLPIMCRKLEVKSERSERMSEDLRRIDELKKELDEFEKYLESDLYTVEKTNMHHNSFRTKVRDEEEGQDAKKERSKPLGELTDQLSSLNISRKKTEHCYSELSNLSIKLQEYEKEKEAGRRTPTNTQSGHLDVNDSLPKEEVKRWENDKESSEPLEDQLTSSNISYENTKPRSEEDDKTTERKISVSVEEDEVLKSLRRELNNIRLYEKVPPLMYRNDNQKGLCYGASSRYLPSFKKVRTHVETYREPIERSTAGLYDEQNDTREQSADQYGVSQYHKSYIPYVAPEPGTHVETYREPIERSTADLYDEQNDTQEQSANQYGSFQYHESYIPYVAPEPGTHVETYRKPIERSTAGLYDEQNGTREQSANQYGLFQYHESYIPYVAPEPETQKFEETSQNRELGSAFTRRGEVVISMTRNDKETLVLFLENYILYHYSSSKTHIWRCKRYAHCQHAAERCPFRAITSTREVGPVNILRVTGQHNHEPDLDAKIKIMKNYHSSTTQQIPLCRAAHDHVGPSLAQIAVTFTNAPGLFQTPGKRMAM